MVVTEHTLPPRWINCVHHQEVTSSKAMNSTEYKKLMPMRRRQMGSARAVHSLSHYSVLFLLRR